MIDEALQKSLSRIDNLTKEDFEDSVKKGKELKERNETIGKNILSFFDMRNLAEQFIEIHPCYYDRSRNWWLWFHRENRWERVDESDILNAVNKQASVDTINSKQKNEIIEALRQVSRDNKPEDIKPTWIQFKDLIIDIETGERFTASPKYFITNPIPYELDKDNFSDTQTIDKIFTEWVGEKYVQSLYEIIAYSLIPSYPIHRIFCFIGAGLNGKSCFLTLLRRFVGHKNCCSTELDSLINSRFEITRLHKKLVCMMGETNFNEMSKTSQLKKLSGGDLIGFEYKNKDPFEEINYAKIIIATNNLPTTTDKTIGFYRRWMIIDFPNQFSEKFDILSTIPDEEFNALALKCTHILKDLLESRAFTNEGSIEERIEKYEEKSNPLEKFMKGCVVENFSGSIWKWEFKEVLDQWCKDNHYREMSDIIIGKKMKELGIKQEQRSVGDFSDGKKWRAWIGIKWGDKNGRRE